MLVVFMIWSLMKWISCKHMYFNEISTIIPELLVFFQENTIISITTDYSRQFIATAAKGTENICAIIWDINEKLPIFTIFSLYPNSDNICLRLPMKAKYLVTLGLDGKRYSLDVWSWTLGKDTPDGTFSKFVPQPL